VTFRLADPDALYPVPVDIPVPSAGGERVVAECEITFRLIGRQAATEAMVRGEAHFVRAVVAGWSGIERHDGSPLQYSEESLDLLADIAHFNLAVSEAYGRWAACLPGKTSKPSPATGGEPAAATTD